MIPFLRIQSTNLLLILFFFFFVSFYPLKYWNSTNDSDYKLHEYIKLFVGWQIRRVTAVCGSFGLKIVLIVVFRIIASGFHVFSGVRCDLKWLYYDKIWLYQNES